MSYTMQAKLKIGPKGQILIPQYMREAIGMVPGGEIMVEMTPQGVLIEKPKDNLIEFIQEFRKSGPMAKDFKKIYEEQLKQRYKRFK